MGEARNIKGLRFAVSRNFRSLTRMVLLEDDVISGVYTEGRSTEGAEAAVLENRLEKTETIVLPLL